MNYIPHILDAEYVEDYKIRVRFDDGAVKLVNIEPYTKRGGVFEALKDKSFFKRFFVDLNTICWPNGADIAPERLYEIGEEEVLKAEVL